MTPERARQLLDRYPSIRYLRERARQRIPHFAWEYLDSGTGSERGISRNRDALDNVLLTPRFMKGDLRPDPSVTLFGKRYDMPLGIAPVGLTGMMWPGGETMLARAAKAHNIAYCLSTVGCETPEDVGAAAGGNAWFQLYPIADKEAEADLLKRAEDLGFSTLVITVDVPVNSTRERQRKAGVGSARMSSGRLAQIIARPQWALETLKRGKPEFRMMRKYMPNASMGEIIRFVEGQRLGVIDQAHIARLRNQWKGALVIKGILDVGDAKRCLELGADGIVVSNHGARQFDAAPPSIERLPAIVDAVGGRAAVLFDSGISSGLDIARAIACGADFVLAGRAFIHGVCAAGEEGAWLAGEILRADLVANMIQLGVGDLAELRSEGTSMQG